MNTQKKEVGLIKDNIMKMNSSYRVFKDYLYCKMKKEYKYILNSSI